MFGILACFLLSNDQLDLNISDSVMLSVELSIVRWAVSGRNRFLRRSLVLKSNFFFLRQCFSVAQPGFRWAVFLPQCPRYREVIGRT